jgi:hypothetical protein
MRTIPYSPKNIRLFLVVLLTLAVFLTVRYGPKNSGRWLWIGAEALFIAVFLAAPKLFFPVYRLLMIGSGFIGHTIFLFFLFLTPYSGLRKLFGKAPIPVRTDPKAPTYFEPAEPTGSAERQF